MTMFEVVPHSTEWPRDYLRAHPDEAVSHERFKRELVGRCNDRRAYTEAKGPFIWEVMGRADRWSQEVGWEPGPSDA